MLRLLLSILCCMIWFTPLIAQDEEFGEETEFVADEFVVQDIEIIGNHLTKEWVIRRELGFEEGDFILYDDMLAARNRLLSLQIFNNVFIEGNVEGTVTIEVSEQFRWIPITALTATDGRTQDAFADFSKFFDIMTATVGVADLNHRGNGGTVDVQARFGATNGFAATYASRWLSQKLPIRFRFGARTLLVSDKHASVQDTSLRLRNQRIFMEIATRRGAQARIGAELKFERVKRRSPMPEQQIQYRTWWLNPFIMLDRRDLEWYPRSGGYAQVTGNLVASDTPFYRSQYTGSYFTQFRNTWISPILALHFEGGTATSSAPDWAHYYFGFGTLLRGYSSVKSEATTYLLGDLELRMPFMRETTYDIPLLGRNGRNIPFWLGGVLFAERAQQQLGGSRTDTWAVGGGLHVRVPFVQIVEIVGSVNRESEFDFVFTTDVRF